MPQRRRTSNGVLAEEDGNDEETAAFLPLSVEDSAFKPSGTRFQFETLRSRFLATPPLFRACFAFGALLLLGLFLFQVIGRSVLSSTGGKSPPPKDVSTPGKSGGNHSSGPTGSVNATLWESRAEKVKAAFVHAYTSYEKYAYPMDELMPLAKQGQNTFNGFGVTVVDSLDTMILMGLDDMYNRGLKHVAGLNMSASHDFLPFFETTIRYLGGLLSAFALSNDTIFLTKADELGRILLPVFDTPSGIPVFSVQANTGKQSDRTPMHAAIADMGTCQLEFKYLARLTGNPLYFKHVDKLSRLMYETQSDSTGMWSNMWDIKTGKQTSTTLQIGGTADSAYEYILKAYLQGAKSEPKLKDMYLKAANGIIRNLVYISPTRHLMYVTDSDGNGANPSGKLEHLSCFFPGILALGVSTLDMPKEDKEIHQWVAEGIALTCWLTYADSKTGLGPDEVLFTHWGGDSSKGKWIDRFQRWKSQGRPNSVPPGVREGIPLGAGSNTEKDYRYRMPAYQLRPETVESLFILWKTTGDEIWRDRAWSIFESIEKHSRVEDAGYSGVSFVDHPSVSRLDNMPSWFLAETLKYLYLLCTTDSQVSLDRWVFNTEAHPLPVLDWRAWEGVSYGIGEWS